MCVGRLIHFSNEDEEDSGSSPASKEGTEDFGQPLRVEKGMFKSDPNRWKKEFSSGYFDN